MARKKVISLSADSTIEWEKAGQQLNGYYIGFKTITSDFGPSKLHIFQTEDGTVGCWGSAQLDEKLSTIRKGRAVYITFGGKVKIKGGKTMKNFEVEYDDEDYISVNDTTVNYSSDAAEEEDNELGASNNEAQEEEESQDVDPDDTSSDSDDLETEQNPAAEVSMRRGTPASLTADKKAKANEVLAKLQAKKLGKSAVA